VQITGRSSFGINIPSMGSGHSSECWVPFCHVGMLRHWPVLYFGRFEDWIGTHIFIDVCEDNDLVISGVLRLQATSAQESNGGQKMD